MADEKMDNGGGRNVRRWTMEVARTVTRLVSGQVADQEGEILAEDLKNEDGGEEGSN
jgi:hypothetical protein